MSSHEEQWWSVRAGEYVIGTLRGEDLRLFQQILAHDTTMRAEVAFWERRLAPLNEALPEATVSAHVLPQLLDQIRRLPSYDDELDPPTDINRMVEVAEVANQLQAPTRPDGASALKSRTKFWSTVAGLTTAASMVLGILQLQQPSQPVAFPLNVDGLAVVLSDEGGVPYFLVETDYGNLRVRVTALSPPSLDESSDFQLWQALPDRSAVRPVALLPEEPGTAKVFDVSSLIDGSDLFGVSIEPIGAATSAGPTGPVVAHGDYLSRRGIE